MENSPVLLPVLARGHTCYFFEDPRKVRGGFKAGFSGDIIIRHISSSYKILRSFNSLFVNKVNGSLACSSLKNSGEIVGMLIYSFGQVHHREILFQI